MLMPAKQAQHYLFMVLLAAIPPYSDRMVQLSINVLSILPLCKEAGFFFRRRPIGS